MLFAILLAAQAAITPAQSTKADALAKAYLTQACSDGNEHYAVVTPDDGILHELTAVGSAENVLEDTDGLRRLCFRPALIAYHCHTTNDVLSLFPGFNDDSGASDFGFAAYGEYVCGVEAARKGLLPPHMEHRFVHTGGAGEVVGFGIRGPVLAEARELGRQAAMLGNAGDSLPTVSHGNIVMPDLRPLLGAIPKIQANHKTLERLYETLNKPYYDAVISYIVDNCPGTTAQEKMANCTALTIQAFASTLDPCGPYVITPPGGPEPKACQVATGERITLSDAPRYPGYTELTDKTYDEFTRSGHAMVTFCRENPGPNDRPCGALMQDLTELSSQCPTLKRAYVDLDRFPKLQQRSTDGWHEAILLENGRYFVFNIKVATPYRFGLIVCQSISGLDLMNMFR